LQADSCLPVTVASYAFDKSLRLLTAKDYKPVFDNAKIKASTQQVLILSRPNQREHPRLGLVIAKKHIRLAVDRNRVKRIIRESFRLHRPQLPALDIVVLARPKLGQLDNAELHATLEQLWRKLQHKSQKLPQSS
jgi:ribonuclease P protein component